MTCKPDGGFQAWLIVAASFIISSIQDGIGYSFGVFLPDLSRFFNASKASTTIIFSSLNLLIQGSGPLSAYLLEIFGYRIMCLLGSVITSLAFLLTALLMHFNVTEIIVYYFITGAMSGLGLGFLYMVARAIISEWFDSRLGIALGLASSGSGLGQLVLAPLIVLLLGKVGTMWTFVFLGGITATGVFFSLVFTVPIKQEIEDKEAKYPSKSCCSCNLSEFKVIKLLKQPSLVIFLVSCFFHCLGAYTVFGFTLDHAISFGFNPEVSSWLFSSMGVGNCLGRIVLGKVSDEVVQKWGHKKIVYVIIITNLMNASSIIFTDILWNIYVQHACAVIFGFSYGGYCSAVIVFLKNRFEDCLGMAIGLYFLTCGLASITGPVITGSLVDGLGTYSVAFLTMGFVVAFSSIILGLIPVVDHFQKDETNVERSGKENDAFTDLETMTKGVQV